MSASATCDNMSASAGNTKRVVRASSVHVREESLAGWNGVFKYCNWQLRSGQKRG